jgi:hypothetical protein
MKLKERVHGADEKHLPGGKNELRQMGWPVPKEER